MLEEMTSFRMNLSVWKRFGFMNKKSKFLNLDIGYFSQGQGL